MTYTYIITYIDHEQNHLCDRLAEDKREAVHEIEFLERCNAMRVKKGGYPRYTDIKMFRLVEEEDRELPPPIEL